MIIVLEFLGDFCLVYVFFFFIFVDGRDLDGNDFKLLVFLIFLVWFVKEGMVFWGLFGLVDVFNFKMLVMVDVGCVFVLVFFGVNCFFWIICFRFGINFFIFLFFLMFLLGVFLFIVFWFGLDLIFWIWNVFDFKFVFCKDFDMFIFDGIFFVNWGEDFIVFFVIVLDDKVVFILEEWG